MEAGSQGGAPSAPETGPFARLIGTFTSPARTFESIAAKPGWDWLLPLILILAMSIVASSMIGPKLDVDTMVSKQMEAVEKRSPQMSDADKEKTESAIRKQMEFFTSGAGKFVGAGFIIVAIFFVPAVYHGAAAAFGVKRSYLGVVAGYTYVQLVQFVKGILFLPIAMSRETIDPNEINRLIKSNLGAFLDPESTGKVAMTLASNIDIFEIAAIVLGSIALSKTTKFSPRGAAYTVIGVWVVWLLVQLAGAAIGAAFGG